MNILKRGDIEVGKASSTSFNGSGSDQSRILVHMPPNPGKVVYLGTCTKVCVISFTLGVFVGFTLKRRFRQWVNKWLKRLKDD